VGDQIAPDICQLLLDSDANSGSNTIFQFKVVILRPFFGLIRFTS
jgi:hypothetical protein